MIQLEAHPAADLFPLMPDPDLEALSRDIEANGLREPIWLHPDGRIIDGRNRYRACMLVGMEPDARTWDGDGDLVALVVSLNLHRRHLSESQRAMIAAKIANLRDGQRADRVAAQNCAPAVSQSSAAELLDVSRRSVQHATKVQAEGAPELVQAVESGEVPVSAAATLAELPEAEQREVVAGGKRSVRATVRAIRDERRAALPYPFLARWPSPTERAQGDALMESFPVEEREHLILLLDEKGIPGTIALNMLRNLLEMDAGERAEIYELRRSDDKQDQSLAKTRAAKLPPMPAPAPAAPTPAPDPRLFDVRGAIRIVQRVHMQVAVAERALYEQVTAALDALTRAETLMEDAHV